MVATKQIRLTPRDVARVLFRHWRKMTLLFCSLMAITLLFIATYPRSYTSEAKLFLKVGRESVALDPTATTGQTIMLQKSQVDEINSALNLLSGREVLEQVVEKVGAERILKDTPVAGGEATASHSWIDPIRETAASVSNWFGSTLKSLRLSDPGTDHDLAIRRLEKGIDAWAPKQSTVITVRYVAASPELAHDIVEATTNAFLEEHLRLNLTAGSLKFFSQQADELHGELVKSQNELRDKKNSFQVVSSDSGRAILEMQMQNVQVELLGTHRELAFADAKIADLTKAISGLDKELVTNRTGGFSNEAKDGMRQKLYDLELQESELKSRRFTDEYPPLAEIRRQRQEAEEILKKVPDDRMQTTAALNPNQRSLELELLQTKSNAEALRGREKAGLAQQASLKGEMTGLNDQEVQLAELERNVRMLEEKYRMHVAKLEEARVNDALGRERISNVSVAQNATTVTKPISPNKALLGAVGLLVAMAVAVGSAFLSESMDQTLRTSDQVEAQLGLPVLMSLPYRKRRRRRSAKTIAASSNGSSNGAANGHAEKGKSGRYVALARELTANGRNGAQVANGSNGSNGANGKNGHRHAKMVGVVGCDTSKLRSRVAAGLAMQAATSGADPVLLIDADSRRRRVAKRFNINGSPGWRDVLAGVANAENCVHQQSIDNLVVMPPGRSNGHDPASKSRGGASGQLDEIKSGYGLVVVDLPPAREMDTPPAAAEWLDEMVLVVEAERTRIQAALRAKDALTRAGVHVAGVVLANRREHIPQWLYQRL